MRTTLPLLLLTLLTIGSESFAQYSATQSLFELGARFPREEIKIPSAYLELIEQQFVNYPGPGKVRSVRQIVTSFPPSETLTYGISFPNENKAVLKHPLSEEEIEIAWNWKSDSDVSRYHASAHVLALRDNEKIAFIHGDTIGKSVVFRLRQDGEIIWKTKILKNGFDSSGGPVTYYVDIIEGAKSVVLLGNYFALSYAVFIDKITGELADEFYIGPSATIPGVGAIGDRSQ